MYSVLEFITDPYLVTNAGVVDRCFRLNGELIPLPQNAEEEKAMDNTLWDWMLKRVGNNITQSLTQLLFR